MVGKVQEMEDYDFYDPVPYQGGYDIGAKYGAPKPADGKYRSQFGLEPPVAQYGNEPNPYKQGHPGPSVCPGCWKPGAVYGGGRDRSQESKGGAQPAKTSSKGRAKPVYNDKAKQSMHCWICRLNAKFSSKVNPSSHGDAKPSRRSDAKRNAKPRSNGNAKPSSKGDVKPSAAQVIADGAAELIADRAAKLIPDGARKLIPDGAAKLIPDRAAKIIADGAGKIIPDGAGKIIPDGAAKLIPDGAAKLVSNFEAKPEEAQPKANGDYEMSEESGFRKLASVYDDGQRSQPGFYTYTEAKSAYQQPHYGYEEAYRPTFSEVDQYGFRNPFFSYGDPFPSYDDAAGAGQPGDSSVYLKPYNQESKASPIYVEQTSIAYGGEHGAYNPYGYSYQPDYYGEETSGYGSYGGYGGHYNDDSARFGGGSAYIEEPIYHHAPPPASNRPFISWW